MLNVGRENSTQTTRFVSTVYRPPDKSTDDDLAAPADRQGPAAGPLAERDASSRHCRTMPTTNLLVSIDQNDRHLRIASTDGRQIARLNNMQKFVQD